MRHFLSLFFLCTCLVLPLQGQTTKETLKTVTDKSANEVERLKAIGSLNRLQKDQQAVLIQLLGDPDEADAIRIAALKAMRLDFEYSDLARRVLTDEGSSDQLLVKLIEHIPGGYSSFTVTYPELVGSLAALRDHKNPEVSKRAIFKAISYHHEATIRWLFTEGIESKRFSADEALKTYRNARGHRRGLEFVRPFLHHKSPEVRVEAIWTLYEDEDSRATIRKLAFDSQQEKEVRKSAIWALRNLEEYHTFLSDPKRPEYILKNAIEEGIQSRRRASREVRSKFDALLKRIAASQSDYPKTIQQLASKYVTLLKL